MGKIDIGVGLQWLTWPMDVDILAISMHECENDSGLAIVVFGFMLFIRYIKNNAQSNSDVQ